MSKVWVYIDGFNLYNGALRRSPHKWLNLVTLSEHLTLDISPSVHDLTLDASSVDKVKLFTAQVERRPNDPDQQARQRMYWRALRTLGNVEIIEGQFKGRHKPLPHSADIKQIQADEDAGISVVGRRPNMTEVYKCEEKGTDVNLAAYLLHDAHRQNFDFAIVVSNDSDLATAIRLVTQEVKLPVAVYSPQTNARLYELRRSASFYRKMDRSFLPLSQLPPTLQDAIGTVTKPAVW